MNKEQKKFFKELMKLCEKHNVSFKSETEYMLFDFQPGEEISIAEVAPDSVSYSKEETLYLED